MTRSKIILAALLATVAIPANAVPAAPAAATSQADAPATVFDGLVGAAKAAMMSDPDVALTKARAAAAVGETVPGTEGYMAVATARWLEGEALTRLNRPEEGKPAIDAALQAVMRHGPGTKLHGDLLKSRASVAALTGDVQAALGMLHRAHAIYTRLGETRAQAMVLQNIGSIYFDARDYPRVLRYYEQANDVHSADPVLALSSHNNRGNAFKEMGEFDKAEREYRLALAIARQMDSALLEARIITNIASAQFLQGRLDVADATAVAGLGRATGGAAEWRPFLWGVRAQIAQAQGRNLAASGLIERTFAGVDLKTSTMPYRDFHAAARNIYEALGRPSQALAHLAAFKRLDDEARDVAVSTNAALMSARFDAANQELRITKLKAQKAQREIALAQSERRLETVQLLTAVGGTAGSAVIGAVLFAFFAARRSRREVSAANRQLTYAARHDQLTGLPNRAYFRELLAEAMERGKACALLLVDLDRFKIVNDQLGHGAGDQLLRMVAERLQSAIGGVAHAARLGGDEFAVIVPNLDQPVGALAERIVNALSAPYEHDGWTASIGASVGVAIAPLDGDCIDGLARSADLALYRAKATGRGQFARFEPWMQEEADERRLLELDLRNALAEERLSLVYQPIVDATTGDRVAYEALLRWDHPTRGQIMPSVFIPIAEEARLINEIGAWVLRTACAQAATWPEHVKVAVNLSALQVEADSLTSTVISALAANGLRPERLELEVTESVFLRQGERSEATLNRLRTIGVSLALDDFGTGYSSLGYLQRAAFSKIKIDRSFVKSATNGCHESIAIIQAIVALAKGLGMETTAEGIETEVERTTMLELGCTQLQGYLFGQPAAQENDRALLIAPKKRRVRRADAA
jgi:diguanylate cyclase (GGDEF)-like protein